MLGINGIEFVVLLILGVLIVGPERLPEYAAQLGQLVRNLRRMAHGAREQLREEVGPDFDDVDWRKLDPRQYDPRRIIKEALTEDIGDTLSGSAKSGGSHKAQAPVKLPDDPSPQTQNPAPAPAPMNDSPDVPAGTALADSLPGTAGSARAVVPAQASTTVHPTMVDAQATTPMPAQVS